MEQFAFTAHQLCCMATLAGKNKLYAIRDPFGSDRAQQMQITMDALLADHIATMDMDGNMALSENIMN